MIDSKKPGDTVKVKVYRDGDYTTLDVTLAEASE
jgi:S1-C subfamily serine protease